MKKFIFMVAILFSLVCVAQSPEANKIVNSLQGAGAPCRTPDGQNGRMYPQSITTTTNTANTSGSSRNSGSNSTTVSSGVSVGTNTGVNAGLSNTSTSGTSSQNNSTTTGTTTQTTSVCVPYKR